MHLLELAGGHAIVAHPLRRIDGSHLGCATAVDSERIRVELLELPSQALQTFARDAFMTVIRRRIARMPRRYAVFGDSLLHKQRAHLAVDRIRLCAVRTAANLFERSLERFRIDLAIRVPRTRRGNRFGIDLNEHAPIVRSSLVEVLLLFEPACALLRQKPRLPLCHLRRRECRLYAVVVPRRNRIELVIVAPRALERMCEECLPYAIGHIIQKSLACDTGNFHPGQLPWTHAEETGCDEGLRIVREELIARELLEHEPVVRLVAVERPNDVIAVAPCVAARVIVREPARIGIPDDVEPVAGHLFAVMRRCEQAIDEASEGLAIGCRVFNKSVDL